MLDAKANKHIVCLPLLPTYFLMPLASWFFIHIWFDCVVNFICCNGRQAYVGTCSFKRSGKKGEEIDDIKSHYKAPLRKTKYQSVMMLRRSCCCCSVVDDSEGELSSVTASALAGSGTLLLSNRFNATSFKTGEVS